MVLQTITVGLINAQVNDTPSRPVDSLHHVIADTAIKKSRTIRPDTTSRLKRDTSRIETQLRLLLKDTSWMLFAAKYPGKIIALQAYQHNHFFGFSSRALLIKSNKKVFKGKELMFYALITLSLLFAFIRLSFPKYIGDLFRVAFKTTLKQRQIGEQLVQTPLPSMLLNFFFLVTASMYISFVLEHYQRSGGYTFWLLSLYCLVGLTIIYTIKFLSLKFFGWLFNISPTTDGYIFIVFMINKIIGIYLLPFLIMLAFTNNDLYQVAFALSYTGVLVLLTYRFILSYGLARSQIRLNPFHFFLYLCAFEIVPLILIYKALVLWF